MSPFFTGLGGNQRTEAESRLKKEGSRLTTNCSQLKFRLRQFSLFRNHALKLKSIKCLRRCLRFSRDSAAISVLKLKAGFRLRRVSLYRNHALKLKI